MSNNSVIYYHILLYITKMYILYNHVCHIHIYAYIWMQYVYLSYIWDRTDIYVFNMIYI